MKMFERIKHCYQTAVVIELTILTISLIYLTSFESRQQVLRNMEHILRFQSSMSKNGGNVNVSRPHILLIVADDLGYHDVGYHGSRIKTPNIDKLALSGVRLENYYVQPLCTPTRGQLLTGRHQIHTGLQWLLWPSVPHGLPLENPTLADKLRDAGYATHMVGKWHLGFYKKEYLPINRGFQSFFGFLNGHSDYYNHSTVYKHMEGYDLFEDDQPANINKYEGLYSTTLYTQKVRDIIFNHNTQKPLFIYLSYQAVHSPMQVPARYINLNKRVKRGKYRTYAGMVTCMDESIGYIVDAMKERGLWDNTITLFTTDNGGDTDLGASNWPLRGGKGCLYEGGIRAVGFVHGAPLGTQCAGTVSNELIHVSDWFPTLVNLAGGNFSGTQPLDGFDQWKTIKYGRKSPRKEILHGINPRVIAPGEPIYRNTFNTTIHASLRIGDWKIITGSPGYVTTNRSEDLNNLLLFNLKLDPRENTDQTERFSDVALLMLKRLEYYQAGMSEIDYPTNDPLSNPDLHNGFWQPWK